jgi:hypothetical protein
MAMPAITIRQMAMITSGVQIDYWKSQFAGAPIGHRSSAVAVHVTNTAWLGFFVRLLSYIA